MSETLNHPSQERLHGFVEESLDVAERGVVDRHLATCEACRTEAEELRSLFASFSQLPSFAPSAGFADRVMAQVRVRQPALAWVAEWAGSLERLVPRTTRGWAAATGVFALPVIAATVVVWWLMSQPGVSPQSLWVIGASVAGDVLATGWQWAWPRLAESTAAVYVSRVLELAGSVGRGEIGLAVAMFVTATAGSIYVLYQNLFRTTARRAEHASYVY